MFTGVLAGLGLVIGATAALPDARQDCLTEGDAGRRIRGCSEVIGGDSRNALAYYKRGRAYGDKGDPDRAIADFTEAIEINPLYGDAYFNRGGVYQDKGDQDRAIADYTKA